MKWILIVDETPVVREIAIAIAQELGLMAAGAGSVEEACALCHEQAPDAMLIDEQIGGATAIEVFNRLRAMPGGSSAVGFMTTTENNPEQLSQAGKAGFTGVLLKPYDISSVRNALKRGGLIELDRERVAAGTGNSGTWAQ